ncbi:hypothetical protein BMF77_00968 [Dolichospermum sp. UHCC 0315A]|nr:hypothetical protein BMF77_00968 [Dolichospermum sp. UHCC 0315A]
MRDKVNLFIPEVPDNYCLIDAETFIATANTIFYEDALWECRSENPYPWNVSTRVTDNRYGIFNFHSYI